MISFNKKQASGPRGGMIMDTCALIDGRIIDIAKSGFVTQNLVIPQFVIAELQYLADNGDSHKRERARFGLDVIRDLQDMRRVTVMIAREQFPNIKEVDDKLIALAKQYGAMLYTTDYNLNKVAQIEGIHVLNVNELAQALRPHRLPGEKLEIKITQVGQDKTQGVGYLEDGTMVVVEKA
ncbi:MAG TPA: PIN domain-containing protein, partial [Candidatus Acidoferrum sp.]|nr:PIN domain-containing protein [Candidatus Acidoferrum sp.]